MKKFFIIIAMTVLCINCFGQAKAVKKIATKISSKTAKRAALKTAEKRSFEVLVKEGINRTGRKYTGQALGEQVVKRALRERIIKDMEEQGLKSFLEYGKNKALKDVERMGFSSVRKEMITRNGSNAYHSTIKRTSRKAATKETAKKILRLEGKAAAEHLAKTRPDLKPLLETLGNKFNKIDDLIVEQDGDKIILSVKHIKGGPWHNSKIEIDGNVIKGNGGGIAHGGTEKGLNEFFDVLLPNKTYIVDDCSVVKTDKYGRIIYAEADRTKMVLNPHRGRNTKHQKELSLQKEGKESDQGGHIFSLNSGGTNESVNLVPMPGKWQANGEWRKFEVREEKAIAKAKKNGSKVESRRRLLYKGSSQRPYGIEVTLLVNGKIIEGPTKMIFPN